MTEVPVPLLAEGVTTATISYLHVKKTDTVREGDNLVELVTDKATFNVTAPSGGTVTSVSVSEGDQVSVGQLLVTIG